MSEPVVRKSREEQLKSFFEDGCELRLVAQDGSRDEAFQWEGPRGRALFERTLAWSRRFDRSESFSPFDPEQETDSDPNISNLLSVRESKLFKALLDWPSGREYLALSDFEEDAAAYLLRDGLGFCFQNDSEEQPEQEEEDVATAREVFIQNLAVHIVDPAVMNRFIATMEGLLGDEPDEKKWKELYDEQFGWSEEDLAVLDDYAFSYEDALVQSISEDAGVAKAVSDPKVSDYVAGLLLRAQSLYGAQDPDFVEEYEDYVQFTLHGLESQNKLGIIAVEDHLRTPEDYRKNGFLNLPERPEGALSGSAFMEDVLGVDLKEFKKNPRQLGSLSKIERENAILEQIELGNIPDFLRRPKAVVIKGPDGGEAKVYVMPDYIAIGSDEDFVRVPLSPLMAKALADKYGLNLPTKTIVEETYQQAGKRVVGPSYTHPGEFEQNSAYLDSAGFYLRSNEDIESQLKGVELGTLVSGGKKEMVVSPFVSERFRGAPADESIDFYGLYGEDGIPIQRTPGHGGEAGYRHTEYALGVRFVSPMVVVRNADGRKTVMAMDEALKDPNVAKIISRLERTEKLPNHRSPALDGPFDPATVYRQNMPKGQRAPRGPGAA